jgi:hypothetical protein
MLFKPRDPETFEALQYDGGAGANPIIEKFSPRFTLVQGLLHFNGRRVPRGSWVFREEGAFRVLEDSVFRELYVSADAASVIDTRVNEQERLALVHAKLDPADYVALPVDISAVPTGVKFARLDTPAGPMDCVVITCMVAVPANVFSTARILGANGELPSPLDGMMPSMGTGRLVLPRVRLTRAVLRQMGDVQPEEANVVSDTLLRDWTQPTEGNQ